MDTALRDLDRIEIASRVRSLHPPAPSAV